MGKRRAPSQNGVVVATNKDPTESPSKEKRSVCNTFQNSIVGGLEKVFFKYGQFVAKHPIPVIIGSLIFAGLCGIRLYFEWDNETDQVALWVPSDSDFTKNQKWLADNFPSSVRLSSIIIKAMLVDVKFM